MMRDRESGRLSLENITLVEYENADETLTYFIQCGIAGFNAKPQELKALHCLLSYYYNMDDINNITMSIQDGGIRFEKIMKEWENEMVEENLHDES